MTELENVSERKTRRERGRDRRKPRAVKRLKHKWEKQEGATDKTGQQIESNWSMV